MTNLKLHFAGNSVGISWDCDLAAHLVDFLFKPIHLLEAPSDQDSSQPEVQFQLTCAEEQGQLLISNNQGEKQNGLPEEVAYPLVERVTYHLANRSQGGMLFHAACLARENQAFLLPGNSGSGKSTLALWLVRHGFDYLSDELVFIPLGSLDCRGLARPVHLRSASCQLFDVFGSNEALESRSTSDPTPGWMVQPGHAVSQAHINAIIFPHYEAETSFSIERLAGSQAVLKLTGCMVNGRNLTDNGFPELIRLARVLPAYSMNYAHFEPVMTELENLLASS